MNLREMKKDEASKLSALYGYYVRASGVFQDFKRARDTVLLPESGEFGELLTATEAMNRLSVYYGLLYALIEGFQECQLHDPVIDRLLASPHLVLLRRYRNAIFHFQADFHKSKKIFDLLENDAIVPWLRSVWKELTRWFTDEIANPMLEIASEAGIDLTGLQEKK